jgi:hypothetical protein
MQTYRLITRLVVSALLYAGCNAAALAANPNPNSYAKGTYQGVGYQTSVNAQGQPVSYTSFLNTITFDGAGHYTGSGLDNSNGTITSGTFNGTYVSSADGTFVATGSTGDVTTGSISGDGNTIIGAEVTAGTSPNITIGHRIGSVSGLNTAAGQLALNANTTGADNSASGALALMSNTTGSFNNAAGYSALSANTTGTNNNAQGSFALSADTTGYGNSAMGANAFLNLTTGFRDVGVGNNTGTNVLAGAYDTYIGWGAAGTVDETGVTRIGNPTYATSTYIAGLNSVVTGAALYVSSSGQVGVLASSERYKTDIATLPAPTDRLGQLRPVSFHLKSEPEGTLQYGLIAEEVAKIYPELVLRDQSGQTQGVRYDELAPLLLSEVQEQRRTLAAQEQELAELREALQELRARKSAE